MLANAWSHQYIARLRQIATANCVLSRIIHHTRDVFTYLKNEKIKGGRVLIDFVFDLKMFHIHFVLSFVFLSSERCVGVFV